jgi:hypothetical protein
MPIPTERKSLDVNLEERYADQKVGGAFDAKKAGQTFSDALNNEFADGFTKGGQNTNLPKKESSYLQGHSTRKYKG